MAMKIHHNIKVLALMILIVLSATGIDWMAHQLSPAYGVPSDYFRNKIIYATFWGLLGLLALRNQSNVTKKTLWISLFISVVLQTRYLLQGYDLSFILLFMFIHFFAFFLPMLVIFRTFPELFSSQSYSMGTTSTLRRNPFRRFSGSGKPRQ